MTKYPKISVIVICYNQQGVIKRAIDSVIIQKDYLYELIISDDHSTDQTWEIVSAYQRQYPNIIKAFRQEQNMGIYENLQSTYDKVTGEIVFFLSGDDAFGNELFKETSKLISKSDLNYQTDRFCVLTNYEEIKPDGNKTVFTQNSLIKKYNPLSLKLRGLIVNRALGESITTFNDRKGTFINKLKESKIPSTLQEGFTDTIPYDKTKRIYYLPIVGNMYYAKIGISTKIKKNSKQRLKDQIEYYSEIPSYIKSFDKNDFIWLNYQKVKADFEYNLSLIAFLKYFFLFFQIPKDKYWKLYFSKECKFIIKNFILLLKNSD